MADGVNDGASARYGAGNGFRNANVRPNGFKMRVIAPEDRSRAVGMSGNNAYGVSVLEQAADDSVAEKSGPSKHRNR
jgi:hypothetical protein